MIEFTVTGIDEARAYLYTVRGRFFMMLRTMIDVAKIIQANTLPLTPYETGQLGESFTWHTLEYNREFIEVEVQMDAVDPDNGFHYAEYQHEEDLYHPPPRAGQQYYLRDGINASKNMAYEIIEQDYLSLFRGVTNG